MGAERAVQRTPRRGVTIPPTPISFAGARSQACADCVTCLRQSTLPSRRVHRAALCAGLAGEGKESAAAVMPIVVIRCI